MKSLILDIETGPGPLAKIEPLLPPIAAPSNWKDPAKIEAYLAEKRESLIADAALSAVTGRVLAVGLLRDADPWFITDENEGDLLGKTWRELDCRKAGESVVTFCGHRFDLPFLARRSWALGVPVPVWFPRDGRFPRRAFTDLAEVWACGDRSETISLDRLAKLVGLPGKTGDGADFARLFATDRKAALDYLANDLRLTRAIFERLAFPEYVPEERPLEAVAV